MNKKEIKKLEKKPKIRLYLSIGTLKAFKIAQSILALSVLVDNFASRIVTLFCIPEIFFN